MEPFVSLHIARKKFQSEFTNGAFTEFLQVVSSAGKRHFPTSRVLLMLQVKSRAIGKENRSELHKLSTNVY